MLVAVHLNIDLWLCHHACKHWSMVMSSCMWV